jgi:hypothetical protein
VYKGVGLSAQRIFNKDAAPYSLVLTAEPTPPTKEEPTPEPLAEEKQPVRSEEQVPPLGSMVAIPMTAQGPRQNQEQGNQVGHSAAGKLILLRGSKQSARKHTVFVQRLSVRLTKNGRPVAGGKITFRLPSFGPSAAFRLHRHPRIVVTVITNSRGVAMAPVMIAGRVGHYAATASANGFEPVLFQLVNRP